MDFQEAKVTLRRDETGSFGLVFLPNGASSGVDSNFSRLPAEHLRASSQNVFLVGSSESEIGRLLGAALLACQQSAADRKGWQPQLLTSMSEIEHMLGPKKGDGAPADGDAAATEGEADGLDEDDDDAPAVAEER